MQGLQDLSGMEQSWVPFPLRGGLAEDRWGFGCVPTSNHAQGLGA